MASERTGPPALDDAGALPVDHIDAERPELPQDHPPPEMKVALKRVAGVLREADVKFMLCGSMATWARGGPVVQKDLDFCLKPEDAERALEALAAAGLRTERPPEGWLFKAWCDGVPIDLLFAPVAVPVTDEILARADDLEVLAVPMLVASIDDIISTKLLALSEHSLDYERPLQIVRALREQISWPVVRARTQHSPYADAFFTLVVGLGIISAEQIDQGDGERLEGFPASEAQPAPRVARS